MNRALLRRYAHILGFLAAALIVLPALPADFGPYRADAVPFGRAVASVALDGVDLGGLLLAADLARVYKAGDKTPWC